MMSRGEAARGGRHARGRGGRGKRQRDDEEPSSSDTSHTTSHHHGGVAAVEVAPSVSPSATLEYHFQVRKVLRSALVDPQFDQVCKSAGNISITMELVLIPLCAVCDAASVRGTLQDPIDVVALEADVRSCLATVCSVQPVVETLAALFSSRVAGVIPKRQASSAPSGASKKGERGRGGGSVHQRGGGGGCSARTTNNNEEEAPPPPSSASAGFDKGLLALPPPPPAYSSGAVLDAANAGLLTPPPVQQFPLQLQQQPPPYVMLPTFTHLPSTMAGLLPIAPTTTTLFAGASQQLQQPQFASPVSTTRIVTLEHVPEHYCSGDAMRPQLQQICGKLRNVFYFNSKHMEGTDRVVVSLNSSEAATELIARLNYMAHVDGSPVIARPASDEERSFLFADSIAELTGCEEQTMAALQAFDTSSPAAWRRAWHSAREDIAQADQELERHSNEQTLTPEVRLHLLKGKVAASERMKHAVAALGAAQEVLEGPLEDTVSSSSAVASNSACLVYISDLPGCDMHPMPDQKVQRFLQPFCDLVDLVHVWRDAANPSRICISLLNVGQVFALLRKLDAKNFTFCGATFSKQRPK